MKKEYSPAIKLTAMCLGWTLGFYGVYRRDKRGSFIALAGLGLAMIGLGPSRHLSIFSPI